MPNVNLYLSEELNEKIEDLKDELKIKSKADVIIKLIERGISNGK
jgi:hypothetical protein